MKVRIESGEQSSALEMIVNSRTKALSPDEAQALVGCLTFAHNIWSGWYGDRLACVWGLVPPSLMSDSAYLWLYTTDAIKDHEFMFVRYSQRMIEQMLELYPRITGMTQAGATDSIRWLRWLGASFGEPQGTFIPFVIRKKTNG